MEEKEQQEFEETLKEYVSQYIAEARDIISKIEEELFAIEKKEGDEAEHVRVLFRYWHTVKGAAGFLGFEKTVELSHKTENLIAKIRDENIPITEDIINAIFDSLEKLKILTENIALAGNEGDIEITDEVRKIQNIVVKLSGIPEPEAKEEGTEKVKVEKEETPVTKKVEIEKTIPSEAAKPPEKAKELKEEDEKVSKVDLKEGIQRKVDKIERKEEKEVTREPEADKKKKKFTYDTIRVATQKIEEAMALTEELILERNFLLSILPKLEERYPRDEYVARLSEIGANMDKIISMLRFSVMKMRMVPIKTLFSKFPGTVRNLAKHFGKRVELITEGEETELDRSIVDEIEEPVIHLIRNAIDHGIENPERRVVAGKSPEGRVYLRAYYEGDNVVIEVEDDGQGIDPERIKAKAVERGLLTEDQALSMSQKDIINLIFTPGFSSKDEVTELSGRGVGMDVVRNKIVELKGTIDIETEVGIGTKIVMKLPLTVGIMNTLKVSCQGTHFFIPLSSVIEITRIERKDLRFASGQAVANWRNSMLPVVYLGKVLGIGGNNLDMYHLIISGVAEKRIGMLVDSVISSEEIAVKTISGIKSPGIAGATISAEGEPVLVIDIYSISKMLESSNIKTF